MKRSVRLMSTVYINVVLLHVIYVYVCICICIYIYI